MVRNESIDALKGLLIIFVIIGHILLGTLDENVLRYIIYSFHMPVFMFISGYLLNYEKISSLTGKGLVIKYWKRMLLPWCLALIVYSLCCSGMNLTLYSFASRFLHPYYHLWYVPTLFVFIVIIWLLSYIKEQMTVFVFLIVIGVIFNNLLISINAIKINYLVFFVLGVVTQQAKIKVANLSRGGAFLCVFFISVSLLWANSVSMDFYIRYLRLPSMIFVCLLSVLPIIFCDKFKSKILRYLGEHSLDIYLWHVLPIMLLKYLVTDLTLYYLLTSGLFVVMLASIWIKTKFSQVIK